MVNAIDQTIEGKKLEDSQKRAILATGDNICVNAGAGSGKTFTILGKIIHILDRKLAKPEEILVMAFNKNVADELKKRVKDLIKDFPFLLKDLEKISILEGTDRKIHTFHSFCFNEIKKKEDKTLAKFLQASKKKKKQKGKNKEEDEYDDDNTARLQTSKFYNDIIQELVRKDQNFSKILIKYFVEYLKIYKDFFDDTTTIDDYKRIHEQELKPLRSPKFSVSEVRSVEECEIANFLFLRGVEYKYEEDYPREKIPKDWKHGYKPDFHLFKKDEKGKMIYDVYIEHFALDKNANPPWFFTDPEKYKKEHLEKIKLHKLNKTKLIATYSYQKLDGTLHNHLIKKLRQNGIYVPEKNVISNEEALKAFKKNKSPNLFTNLIQTFLTNFKTREFTFKKLKERINIFKGYEKRKAEAFIYLFEIFYSGYHDILRSESKNGAVDFEDMLILGRKYVELERLKFLIIDEFQDISPLRASVIQNLRKKHNFKFFCVGDDWQSIYRFAGGDIGIMVFDHEFEKCFGKREIINLESTHRFGDRLCEATTSFILSNVKGQLKKTVKSVKSDNQPPLEIFFHDVVDNDFSVRKHVIKRLDELFEKHKNDKRPIKVLFLSRFNTTTYTNNYGDLRKLVRKIFDNKKKYIKFSTVHKAKGVEFDYVFLMNVNSTKLGFPSNIDDDVILKLIIDHIDIFPNEEERRLFYVALTRTKNRIFIYATKGEKSSSFINEITSSSNGKFKKGYHYIADQIEKLNRPKMDVEILTLNNSIKSEDNPAKKKGLEKGFLIESINDVKDLDADTFYQEIRESKGKEMTLLVQDKQNVPEIVKIKPINLSEEGEEERYSLGFWILAVERDPFFYELIKKYRTQSKKIKNDRK